MELRRPGLADKTAILEMIAEYKEQGLPMNGGVESAWACAEKGVFRQFCLLPLIRTVVH